jgi:hypothetical protein
MYHKLGRDAGTYVPYSIFVEEHMISVNSITIEQHIVLVIHVTFLLRKSLFIHYFLNLGLAHKNKAEKHT